MADDYEVALRVGRALEAAGVEYVLGGSLASSLHGDPRSTNDIDFAVRLVEPQVPALVAALGPDFEVDEPALREAIRTRRSHSLYFLPSVLKIDLFIRGGTPFDDSELSRRTPLSVGGSVVFVATPEDTILRKLLWFRAGGEVSDRQWRDVLGIFRVCGPRLDRDYLRSWAGPLGIAGPLARAEAQG